MNPTRLLAAFFVVSCAATLSAATPSSSRPAKPLAWDNDTYAYLYDYDGAGNVIKAGDDQYRYDAFGRLVYGTAKTAAFTDNLQTFSYDRFGNLLKVTTTSGAQSSVDGFAVDADRNQLSNSVPCPPGSTTCHLGAYDADGNRTGTITGVTEYQWDAAGMMTELNLASRHEEYVYDANDERIAVVDRPGGTARYTLRGADKKVLRELSHDPQSGTWSWSRDYVYRDGTLLAEYLAGESGAGPHRHYHVDHLGTPRLITDAGGYKVSLHTYWPFGAEARGSERDTERMKFTGHERDANAAAPGQELDYMHARYYAAIEGRFLSVDPIVDSKAARANPQAWHRYAYVRNNPLKNVDATGMFAEMSWTFQLAGYLARQIVEAEMQSHYYAVVWGNQIGHSQHEGIYLADRSGRISEVWEHNIGWPAPHEGVPWKGSFAQKHADWKPISAKRLGSTFRPHRGLTRPIDSMFADKTYQCSTYCELQQSPGKVLGALFPLLSKYDMDDHLAGLAGYDKPENVLPAGFPAGH